MYGFFDREHCGTNLHSHMSHCGMCSLVELQLTYTRNFPEFPHQSDSHLQAF